MDVPAEIGPSQGGGRGGLTVRDRQRDPKVTLFSTAGLFPGVKCLIPFVLAGTGGSCQKWDDL